ncbi:MAG: GDSL-type esterase/lipase family protein [Hyphomicrobiales bacterium]|nr:GDSL-type esterase/lipase family protein [Hyphomicrobiales bacterium]
MSKLRGWGFVAGVSAALLGVCVGVRASDAPEAARPVWCPTAIAERSQANDIQYRKIAEKLQQRQPIRLVAIGSSSTEGSDLADRQQAYPVQMERRLNALFGAGAFIVLNKGRGGEAMPETIARFDSDVEQQSPDLVIWQLGVNDVVRQQDMSVSARNVDAGLRKLDLIGAPVILMDMQLAPKVLLSTVLQPMRALLADAATRRDALLWSRFDLMRGIVDTGGATMAELIKADELHMTVPMHACTGIVLAETIAARLPLRVGQDVASTRAPGPR